MSKALWESNDKAGAKLNSDEAKRLTVEAEKADKKAAESIFAVKNARVQATEIDLHGLRVTEAVEYFQYRLDSDYTKKKATFLVVIYGAGHHSASHMQKIKPAILGA